MPSLKKAIAVVAFILLWLAALVTPLLAADPNEFRQCIATASGLYPQISQCYESTVRGLLNKQADVVAQLVAGNPDSQEQHAATARQWRTYVDSYCEQIGAANGGASQAGKLKRADCVMSLEQSRLLQLRLLQHAIDQQDPAK